MGATLIEREKLIPGNLLQKVLKKWKKYSKSHKKWESLIAKINEGFI